MKPATVFPWNQTFWVALLLLASRPLGLIREMVFAWKLGVSADTDAFFAAFAVVEVLTDAIATGFLAFAIIPVFARLYHTDQTRREAWRALSLSLNCFGALCLLLVVAGEFSAGPLVRLVFPGFAEATAERATSVLRWLLPFFFLHVLGTVLVGALQSLGKFVFVAVVQLLQNVLVILAILLLAAQLGVYSVALGLLVFGGLQLLLFGRQLLAADASYWPQFAFRDPLLRSTLRLGAYTFLATLLLNAGYLMNRYFGSLLGEGAVSAMAYAIRFKYLVVAVAAFPLATTLFPSMAQTPENDPSRPEALTRAIRLALLVTLPLVLLLVVERTTLIALVYQRGAFGPDMAVLTADALLGYALGVVPYGLCLLFQRYFVAHHRTRPAVVAYGVSLACIAVLTPFLLRMEGISGATLAFSLGETAAVVAFFLHLSPAERRTIFSSLHPLAFRIPLALALATAILLVIPRGESAWVASRVPLTVWELLRLGSGCAVYSGLAYFWGRAAGAKEV